MKNIKDILSEFGIETDKAGEVEKAVLENYRTKAELDSKASRISELEKQLADATEALEAAKTADVKNADEVQAMRERIDAFEKADAERKAQATERDARAAFDAELEKATEGKAFANDLVRSAVSEKAFAVSKANPDMDVKTILAGVVGDADGIWQNPQQDVKKMPAGGTAQGGTQTIQNLDDLKGMSLDEIRAHMSEVDKLLEQQR